MLTGSTVASRTLSQMHARLFDHISPPHCLYSPSPLPASLLCPPEQSPSPSMPLHQIREQMGQLSNLYSLTCRSLDLFFFPSYIVLLKDTYGAALRKQRGAKLQKENTYGQAFSFLRRKAAPSGRAAPILQRVRKKSNALWYSIPEYFLNEFKH